MPSQTFPVPSKRPAASAKDGWTWLAAAGYVAAVAPGCVAVLPFGQRVIRRLTKTFRAMLEQNGYGECAFPVLQPASLWEASGRGARFAGGLFETEGGNARFVVNPTQEEVVLAVTRQAHVRPGAPLRLFQVSDRARNETRPAHGLVRGRTFLLADCYAVAADDADAAEEAARLRGALDSFLRGTGLVPRWARVSPTRGGVRTDSLWVPTVTPQCVVHACGSCAASFRDAAPLAACAACGGMLTEVAAAEVADVVCNDTAIAAAMGEPLAGRSRHLTVAGLGLSRLLQLLAERYHDERGLCWPHRLAPYDLHIVAAPNRAAEAEKLEAHVTRAGGDVFVTVAERLPRGLIDAELIGVPIQAVLGARTAPGTVETRFRGTDERHQDTTQTLIRRWQDRLAKEQQT